MNFKTFESYPEMETAMVSLLGDALAGRLAPPPYAVMLTGGRTPLPIYARLAASGLRAHPEVYVVLSDERYVSPGDAAHNFSGIVPALDAMGVSRQRRLVPRTELPLDQAVAIFDADLWTTLGLAPLQFALLGMGADGHVAGLFTDDDVRRGEGDCAVAVSRPDGMRGISVSASVLGGVAQVVLFVQGADKGPAVAALGRAPNTLIAGRVLGACPRLDVWYCMEAG